MHLMQRRSPKSHWSYGMDTYLLISVMERNYLCYHDFDVMYFPQPIRVLKLGHVLGQRALSSPGKIALTKSVNIWIILLDIWLQKDCSLLTVPCHGFIWKVIIIMFKLSF